MRLILIGFAASYKTSAGKILAEKLHTDFWDTDVEVEKRLGKSVAQIIEQDGEEQFRRAECEVLQQLATVQGVISCGGGSVLFQTFNDFAQNSTVVWLKTSAETVRGRLQKGTRPLFDHLSLVKLEKMVSLREQIYKNKTDICVTTDGKTPQQVADEILQLVQAL